MQTHEQFIHDLKNLITVERLRTFARRERLVDMQKSWEIQDILRSMESSVTLMERTIGVSK